MRACIAKGTYFMCLYENDLAYTHPGAAQTSGSANSHRVLAGKAAIRMRLLICLLALGWMQTAAARLPNANCLRGHPAGHSQPHGCSPAPRTDHAGSGRVG